MKVFIRELQIIVSKRKSLLGLGISFISVFRNSEVGTAELAPISFSGSGEGREHNLCYAIDTCNLGLSGVRGFMLLMSMTGPDDSSS